MTFTTRWHASSKWGKLPQLQLPSFMLKGGVLILKAAQLRVLVLLLHLHKSRFMQRRDDEVVASVKVGQKTLTKSTGVSRKATISAAVHRLEKAGFIQIERDRTGSTKRGTASSRYIITEPDTREPIELTPKQRNILGLRFPYFTISTCLLTSTAHWSLANLKASEVQLYIAMLWIANREHGHRFERTSAELCRSAALTSPTFKKAFDGLRNHGLVSCIEYDPGTPLAVDLCDPFTGDRMHSPDGDDTNDPANYFTRDAKGVSHRLMCNLGTDAERAQLIRESISEDEPVLVQRNGDITIRCPFHDDSKPSCSVSPRLRLFHCFGCEKKGTFTELIGKLTGSKASEIQRVAKVMGLTAEFRQPHPKVDATYDYRDINGILKKRVLRFPNDDNGNKVINQFRWTKDSWVPGTKGVGPLLYNAHLLKAAGTVVIVEGEKDANSITDLHLAGCGGATIGVTSGGSQSWKPKLARLLRGKAVIVMPDNDVSGEAYAEAIRASLDAEGIKYQTVSFAGTGAKDATDYLQNGHTDEELVQLIDSDWIGLPVAGHRITAAHDAVSQTDIDESDRIVTAAIKRTIAQGVIDTLHASATSASERRGGGTIASIIRSRLTAWNADEFAALIGTSKQHIYKLAKAGRMPSHRIGGAVRFDPQELADWWDKKGMG
jgi:excisionase family DNA binding protein